MKTFDPLTWTVGNVRVTKVLEEVIPTSAKDLLPTSDPAILDRHRQWLVPDFVDGKGNVLVSAHALVVESQGRRIVVDTCVGNGKVRPFPGWSDLHTDFLDRLIGAGLPPQTIDTALDRSFKIAVSSRDRQSAEAMGRQTNDATRGASMTRGMLASLAMGVLAAASCGAADPDAGVDASARGVRDPVGPVGSGQLVTVSERNPRATSGADSG